MKILITGKPGIGKTTVLQKIALQAKNQGRILLKGFYTEEIRIRQTRVGFKIEDWEGNKDILAHKEFDTQHRVGKYGIDLARFEKIALPTLELPKESQSYLYLIDEIGKMECFSEAFCNRIRELFQSPQAIISTIASGGPPFVREIKSTPQIQHFQLDMTNRNEMPERIWQLILTQF